LADDVLWLVVEAAARIERETCDAVFAYEQERTFADE
jgi:hypothetical protein